MRGAVEQCERPSWTSVSAYPPPSRTVYDTTTRPYSTKPGTAYGTNSGAAHASRSNYTDFIYLDGGGDGGGDSGGDGGGGGGGD
jgi:hypothetical protein